MGKSWTGIGLGLGGAPFLRRGPHISVAAKLLLDLVPDAAVAYSTRQLSSAYKGPVVRVRRSSNNDEQDFTAKQITDGTLLAFCGAGNGFIVAWYDQSGNERNATQTTTGNQPRIVNNGVLEVLSDKPAFRSTSGSQQLTPTLTGLSQPISQAAVYSVTGTSTRLPFGQAPSFSQSMTLGARSSGTYMIAAPTILDSGTHPVEAAQAAFVLFNGENSYGRWNGTQRAVGNAGSNVFIGQIARGPCFAAETIYWNSDQTANRALIEANQAAHFGITLAS